MKLFKNTLWLGAFLAASGTLGAESYYFNSVTDTVQSDSTGTNIPDNAVEGVAGTFVDAADADEFRFEGDLIFESEDRVYFGGDKPIRIWINGLQVAQYKRTLDGPGVVWAVADVIWTDNGDGTGNGMVNPYPSDSAPPIVGTIADMPITCLVQGQTWTFP